MEAARNSIYLEITARKGHSLTNGHVAMMARRAKASVILNSDSHAPHDLVHKDMGRRIALGAGLTEAETEAMFRNSEVLVKKSSKK
jgi:histidinol phosphatase-like PHP family hydrolase